jgi:hypothetical protein
MLCAPLVGASKTFQAQRVQSDFNRQQSQQSRLELGCGSAVDSQGRTIFVADAHRGDGRRFVVRADEKLTAFVELESAGRGYGFFVTVRKRQSRQNKRPL